MNDEIKRRNEWADKSQDEILAEIRQLILRPDEPIKSVLVPPDISRPPTRGS
jgi:hypothetical protein